MKNQIIKNNYAIYNGDCMEVMPTLPDNSVDLAVYSPPFASLYIYSSDPKDMSNSSSMDEFLEHYEFLVKEMARVTKPGRINAIHCCDLLENMERLKDFPHEIIKIHERNGFIYRNRITVWKEPLKVRIKTMVQSLMHKYIMEDSTKSFTAMPDYILIFKRKGENEVPVTHPFGIQEYYGSTPILPGMLQARNNAHNTTRNEEQLRDHLLETNEDTKVSKINHYIRQRYASAIRDDIRVENCLPYRDSREDDDEKHITPTQLDVIDRIVELYSNPGEVVLTPFMGVGSEVYSPVSHGRKAIGIELKESYFKQAKINLEHAEKRFEEKIKQNKLF